MIRWKKYGIDSIMVMEFTQRLESDFGWELSRKTLLFGTPDSRGTGRLRLPG